MFVVRFVKQLFLLNIASVSEVGTAGPSGFRGRVKNLLPKKSAVRESITADCTVYILSVQ